MIGLVIACVIATLFIIVLRKVSFENALDRAGRNVIIGIVLTSDVGMFLSILFGTAIFFWYALLLSAFVGGIYYYGSVLGFFKSRR